MTEEDLDSALSKARRGRPRGFERDKALRQAMEAFWAHGYEGTSMTQLVDAMGIVSPSIYAAFGSKEQLFREAVDLYVASESAPTWQALDQIDDVGLAVRTMLFTSIDSFYETEPPRGCLLVLGTGALGGAEEPVRVILRDQRNNFRERLSARMKRAIDDGDIPPQSDPEVLAECVMAFFGGLAHEAVDGVPKATLREAVELFCARLFAA